MASTIYTDVNVTFDGSHALADVLGAWRLTYKKHGVERTDRFLTATQAAQFGADLESGKLDGLPGNAPAMPATVQPTRGPWRINPKSMFGPDYVDIDGGAGMVGGWHGLASVAVRTNGERSQQGEANARLIGAARPILDALRAVLDAAEVAVREASADIYTDAPECEDQVVGARTALDTLDSARKAALALLDAAGVPR
jgi:hypothetical protein